MKLSLQIIKSSTGYGNRIKTWYSNRSKTHYDGYSNTQYGTCRHTLRVSDLLELFIGGLASGMSCTIEQLTLCPIYPKLKHTTTYGGGRGTTYGDCSYPRTYYQYISQTHYSRCGAGFVFTAQPQAAYGISAATHPTIYTDASAQVSGDVFGYKFGISSSYSFIPCTDSCIIEPKWGVPAHSSCFNLRRIKYMKTIIICDKDGSSIIDIEKISFAHASDNSQYLNLIVDGNHVQRRRGCSHR